MSPFLVWPDGKKFYVPKRDHVRKLLEKLDPEEWEGEDEFLIVQVRRVLLGLLGEWHPETEEE